MSGSAVEQQLADQLRAHDTTPSWRPGSWVKVVAEVTPGVVRTWFTPFPVLLEIADRRSTPGDRLRECLAEVGLGPETVELFAVAAMTIGALATGEDLASIAPPAEPAAQPQPSSGETWGECGEGDPGLAARSASASGVLDLVGSLTRLTAHLEGALVAVVSDLTLRNGRLLLARKGVTGPAELTPNQTARWRARSKSVTRSEIEALTGWGEGEVSDLVALANAPAAVQAPVVASMDAGVTPWRLARRFLRELGHEAHEDTAEVAEKLFGTDPGTACTDRLDPDGEVKDGPWEHKLFNRALAGEATRLASRDPHAAAEARRRSRQKRDVRVVVNEDGTGAVTVSGTASQVTAVGDRLERAAREARAIGDPRCLADLRADIAMSLLMHSGLALPDPLPVDADDLVRTAWTEQMRTVLGALPAAVLNVIVPFDALVHSPRRPLFGAAFFRPTGPPACPTPAPASGVPPPAGHEPALAPQGQPGDRGTPGGHGGHRGHGGDHDDVLSMGLVTGAFPQFLTPDAIRELALTPGTTLYRLLIDTADGRCVERSITAYAPDAAMRAQVHAADVTCRAPGCVQHAPYTQLDHVIAYGAGGPTSETNLQDLHTRHHDGKTHGGWEAVMAPNRDVTWTSLLGRIYRTRAHDYRQYSTLFRAAVERVHGDADQALADDAAVRSRTGADGSPVVGVDGRGELRPRTPLTRQAAVADAVDRAVYRALTYRGPARPLRAGDDHPDTDTDPAFLGWEIISLTHTTATGQRRHGPDPAMVEQERDTQHAGDGGTETEQGQLDHGRSPTTGDAGTGWGHSPDNEAPPF